MLGLKIITLNCRWDSNGFLYYLLHFSKLLTTGAWGGLSWSPASWFSMLLTETLISFSWSVCLWKDLANNESRWCRDAVIHIQTPRGSFKPAIPSGQFFFEWGINLLITVYSYLFTRVVWFCWGSSQEISFYFAKLYVIYRTHISFMYLISAVYCNLLQSNSDPVMWRTFFSLSLSFFLGVGSPCQTYHINL